MESNSPPAKNPPDQGQPSSPVVNKLTAASLRCGWTTDPFARPPAPARKEAESYVARAIVAADPHSDRLARNVAARFGITTKAAIGIVERATKRSSGLSHNMQILREEIIARSESDVWNEARFEWDVVDVWMADEPQTCLCTHHPIIEICRLRNRENGNHVRVGNVCVDWFTGVSTDRIFACLKRIREKPTNAINSDTADLFYTKGVISEEERDFCKETEKKRCNPLDGSLFSRRRDINARILAAACEGGLFRTH